jgi:hypothetical protein
MIVGNFDSNRVSVMPFKANSPLIVDGNTVLAFPISAKLMQPVPWRHPQIIQADRAVKHDQFSPCGSLKFCRHFEDNFLKCQS